ncbi:MAG: hypothetical protein RLN96_10020, partial [Pseudomonadales bacterium]
RRGGRRACHGLSYIGSIARRLQPRSGASDEEGVLEAQEVEQGQRGNYFDRAPRERAGLLSCPKFEQSHHCVGADPSLEKPENKVIRAQIESLRKTAVNWSRIS